MTTLTDLPRDLVEEIFSRVPLTSLSAVRSSCKKWNASSKNHILGQTGEKQFPGLVLVNLKVCTMKLDQGHFFDQLPLKRVSIFHGHEPKICNVFHCDGLLLCLNKDRWSHVVLNPYLGQTRCIRPMNLYESFHWQDMYAFGYDQINRNHKILRLLDHKRLFPLSEIYDFDSDSWRVLGLDPGCVFSKRNGVSLKGNTYFVAQDAPTENFGGFLLRFDFTAERFGPRLPLPFHTCVSCLETVSLSCVRDEKLALLYQRNEIMEIWITTKIETNAVSWSSFLRVRMRPLHRFPDGFTVGTFFIDEEKKVAVVSDFRYYTPTERRPYQTSYCQTAYVIGEHRYHKSLDIRGAPEPRYNSPLVFSSYVPSLVQPQRAKGKKEIIN